VGAVEFGERRFDRSAIVAALAGGRDLFGEVRALYPMKWTERATERGIGSMSACGEATVSARSLVYNEGMQRSAVARNGAAPAAVHVTREQAAANALGLLRAEGLEPSPEHNALAARWVAGEINDEQFEQLNLEQVRQRVATTAGR
jgi:hypothetical protein